MLAAACSLNVGVSLPQMSIQLTFLYHICIGLNLNLNGRECINGRQVVKHHKPRDGR